MSLEAPDGATDTMVGEDHRPMKVAILLPTSPDWRMLRKAAELAAALRDARDNEGCGVELTVGLPEPDDRAWRAGEKLIQERVPGTVVRHVDWTEVPVANVRRMFADLPATLELVGLKSVSVPRDWGWNFQDCDAWISLAGTSEGAILPLRPTAHYCGGMPERYLPEIVARKMDDPAWERQVRAFRTWRQGVVVTSDPDTVPDLVSYAGVRRERIEVVPDLLDGLAAPQPAPGQRDPHLVYWVLRGTAQDELANVLAGLSVYHRDGGTLEVVVLADRHRTYANHPSYDGLPHDYQELYLALPKVTYHGQAELDRLLQGAGILLTGESTGGEPDHVHAARRCGLHLVAPAFGLTEREVARQRVAATLYAREDPLALADALHQVEQAMDPAANLPLSGPIVTPARPIAFGFLLDRLRELQHGG